MTACSNRKGRAGRVITAALVGALSVGAPAVALAANGGVEMMTADAAAAFSNGEVTAVSGGSISDDKVSLTANGSAQEVVPTEVTTATGVKITLADEAGNYRVTYVRADSKGEPTSEQVSQIVDPGKYCVRVEAVAGDYAGGAVYLPVEVKAADLGTLEAYEVNPSSSTDCGDEQFVYTGSELEVGIKQESTDVALEEGVDYEVKFLKSGSSVDAAGVEVKDAGKYYAVVTGLGKYAGQSAKLADFEVKPFGLEGQNVKVVVDPVIDSNEVPAHPTEVYWTSGGYTTYLDPTLVDLEVEGVFGKEGVYKATVTPSDPDSKNVTGQNTTATVDKYAERANVLYDGEDLPASFTIDMNVDEAKRFEFDETKITAEYGEKGTIGNDECTVTVTDADGNEAPEGWQSKVGTYTVKVVAEAADHSAAAVETFQVVVKGVEVDADASVYITYDGKVTTGFETDWTSEGISLDKFDVVAKDADGKVISDKMSLTVTNSDGAKVEKTITDAGTYTVTVSSGEYELTGDTSIEVVVNPLNLDELRLSHDKVKTAFGYTYVQSPTNDMTGLKVQYLQGVDADSNGKLDDWADLGSMKASELDNVSVKFQKLDEETGVWADVAKISGGETGTYRVVVTPLDSAARKNYVFATDEGTTLEFEVIDGDIKYADVLPSSWWFEPVTAVTEAKYMNGYAGTQFFGSTDTITRGQVACVLYNMAVNYDQTNGSSTDLVDETELTFDETKGYVTGFDDVDGNAYYGKAIAWAKQAGVINGFEGSFRPDDAVTREEFAAMVANFAKKVNDFTPVDVDSALGEFDDAAEVSAWAEESVAWAVANDVMGNGGAISPSADITRAEAAAMVYNYALA